MKTAHGTELIIVSRKITGGGANRTFTYDNTCACGGKMSAEAIENYGTINYTYTAGDGRLDTTTYPGGVAIQNIYDNMGNVTDMKLNGNIVTHYDYNEANQVWKVTDKITGTDKIYDVGEIDHAGHKLRINYPNDTAMVYEYNSAYKLTKANGIKSTGEIITKHEIPERDAVGNITKKNVNTGEINYSYDNIYQLTSYSNPVAADEKNIVYEYDYAGNRDSVTIDGVNHDYTANNLNQLTTAGDITSFTYDNNGNMTGRGSDTFGWDYNNRLIFAVVGSKNITYKYNRNDLRVEKMINSTTTKYYYNGTKLLASLV